jgi:DNA-3-methyladenine glycosylase II
MIHIQEDAMKYFEYGSKEIDYLKKRDAKLAATIDKIGFVKREVYPDVFAALISNIISQQVSIKAAVTVKSRLKQLVGEVTPERISHAAIESIQQCGMSMRKADYIKGIAQAAVTKTVDFKNLDKLSDQEVVKELTKLKGVGEWTAEMLLIHSLERPDILSFKDLGIRRGLIRLHSLEDLSREAFELYRERYSPYNTVASLYLWKLAEA